MLSVPKVVTRLVLLCLITVAPAIHGSGVINNVAPFWVDSEGFAGRPEYQRSIGPFIEHRLGDPEVTAVRPLWVRLEEQQRDVVNTHVIYPVFSHWQRGSDYSWRLLNQVRGSSLDVGGKDVDTFEIWPFFWHRDSGDPETSYTAVFPIAGTLKNRLFHQRIDWVLFPLYSRFTTRHHVDDVYLWPIFRYRSGPASRGFGVFPIFGHFERDRAYNNTYALWPFLYNNYRYGKEEQPYHALGVLPFYARETAAGLKSESFVWPFFGYTREWDPRPRYGEIRFFYPFIVQGRGEEKYVNRILPLYAHEQRPGYEKHWYLWPLLKTEERDLGSGLISERQSLLYFLYWNEVQRAELQGFEARKTHLWPFYSYWNSGTGSRQFQLLSPLEVFFPNNQAVRETWSPFFAVYRYDRMPGSYRHSVLWDLILHQRSEQEAGFYLGPLFERVRDQQTVEYSLLKGFLKFERDPVEGRGYSALWGLLKSD